jgi:hypothetical protein
VLIENPIVGYPFIQLDYKSPKINLEKDMTLKDLENKLKSTR